MSTSKDFAAYAMEQLSNLDEVACRPMMGEYVLYYRGKVAGGFYDDRLFIKPVQAARALLPDAPLEPPYKGSKDLLLVEDLDDRDFLARLFEAMYDQLPETKKRKRKPVAGK